MKEPDLQYIFIYVCIFQKIGVWPTLDEESKFAQSNDLKFVERLRKNFPKGHLYNSLLTFARGERAEFGVKHFAGAVRILINTLFRL